MIDVDANCDSCKERTFPEVFFRVYLRAPISDVETQEDEEITESFVGCALSLVGSAGHRLEVYRSKEYSEIQLFDWYITILIYITKSCAIFSDEYDGEI